jgi:hypothetical protein
VFFLYCRPEYVEAQGLEALGMGGSMLEALHKRGGLPLSPELTARLQQAQQQQRQDTGRAQGRVAAEALQQLLSKPQVCDFIRENDAELDSVRGMCLFLYS